MKLVRYGIAIALWTFFAGSAIAGEKWLSQNWTVDQTGQNYEAYTINESKSSFGVFCSGGQCLFYLHQGLNCTPGVKYSVLLNSQSVSTALKMECTRIGGNLFQILEPFDLVFKAIQQGQMIGFAVALQSGAFAVNRFSLLGAKPAIEKVLLEAAKTKQSRPKVIPPNLSKPTPQPQPQPKSKDLAI